MLGMPIGLLFILACCAYLGIYAERVPYLSKISGVFITMSAAAFLSNTGLIPHSSPMYDMVWQYFIPLSIPFILMRAQLKIIITQSGSTLIAFIIGGVGTILGSILAFFLVSIGPETSKIISMFCASYIGGSINYVAVSKTLELQNLNLFLAGNAADNVVMAFYFSILGFMSSHSFFKKFLKKDKILEDELIKPYTTSDKNYAALDIRNLILALSISTGIYTLAFFMEKLSPYKGIDILLITLLTLLLVNSLPKLAEKMVPYEIIGFSFLYIFFAVIGASADIVLAITTAPKIILIAFIIVMFHLVWIFCWGKIFKLGLKEIIIASNANIGGSATAAAMATTQQWYSLVVPGILCGTLGYALATFMGTALGVILER